jgi:hypothetical protein
MSNCVDMGTADNACKGETRRSCDLLMPAQRRHEGAGHLEAENGKALQASDFLMLWL